jgi:hypothetical protein
MMEFMPQMKLRTPKLTPDGETKFVMRVKKRRMARNCGVGGQMTKGRKEEGVDIPGIVWLHLCVIFVS